MSKRLLPLAAMEKIIKKVNADMRVSDKAKAALKSIVEEKANNIAEKAWRYAQHTGRKTIKKEDIELAAKADF